MIRLLMCLLVNDCTVIDFSHTELYNVRTSRVRGVEGYFGRRGDERVGERHGTYQPPRY